MLFALWFYNPLAWRLRPFGIFKSMQKTSHSLTRFDWLAAAAISALALVVYALTLTPSLSYLSPDGNELATVPYVLGLAHSPGYPLYTWIGKAFTLLPFGDVAHRINLMSAVLGAAGAAGLYLIGMLLLPPNLAPATLRRAAASAFALRFAFSPTMWSQSVIAEVYAPNIAFVALTLLTLLHWERTRRDRDFFLFALVFGLSLGMHLSDLGFALGLAVFVLLTDPRALIRPRWWLAALAGFGMGLAQFLWLPLRAATLNDRFMLQRAPLTLDGIYRYTLGAFPQFKFAFPLAELPDRLVIYLDMLRQELGLGAITLGTVGLGSLLLRRTRHYFLLVGMYLVHVWFFIQYRVFDLEVFFLPAHFLWAIFSMFGLAELLAGMYALARALLADRGARILRGGLALATMLPALLIIPRHWSDANHSHDVAIDDFYTNVWEMLPERAALLTQGGVFGYDAFYWRLVYRTRSDVLLPLLPSPNPARSDLQGRSLYSTTPTQRNSRARGPGALPPDLVPQDLWQVPVLFGLHDSSGLFGSRRGLTLYALSSEPPALTAPSASPEHLTDATLAGATLLGYDSSSDPIESGGRLHITLYWRLRSNEPIEVELVFDEMSVAAHEIGFGLLARYCKEEGCRSSDVVVEDFWIVVPSTASAGQHELSIQTAGGGDRAALSEITVVNQERAMERWLRIAGKSP